MNKIHYGMRICMKTQNYLLHKSKSSRIGVDEVFNGRIHLINSPLIRNIMMEESLALPQFWLT